MAVRAIRDTFALESVDADTEVRRFVKAGTVLYPHYRPVSEEDVVEVEANPLLTVGNPAGSTPSEPRVPPPPAKVAKK